MKKLLMGAAIAATIIGFSSCDNVSVTRTCTCTAYVGILQTTEEKEVEIESGKCKDLDEEYVIAGITTKYKCR